jgi:hypothetical protein
MYCLCVKWVIPQDIRYSALNLEADVTRNEQTGAADVAGTGASLSAPASGADTVAGTTVGGVEPVSAGGASLVGGVAPAGGLSDVGDSLSGDLGGDSLRDVD